MRIGQGYDIHPLLEGRPLILGGISIPHSHGLDGHSDADALTHAVCDALLGAMGDGDLGTRYPSSNPAFKNLSSLLMLEDVVETLGDKKIWTGECGYRHMRTGSKACTLYAANPGKPGPCATGGEASSEY